MYIPAGLDYCQRPHLPLQLHWPACFAAVDAVPAVVPTPALSVPTTAGRTHNPYKEGVPTISDRLRANWA